MGTVLVVTILLQLRTVPSMQTLPYLNGIPVITKCHEMYPLCGKLSHQIGQDIVPERAHLPVLIRKIPPEMIDIVSPTPKARPCPKLCVYFVMSRPSSTFKASRSSLAVAPSASFFPSLCSISIYPIKCSNANVIPMGYAIS